MYSTELLILGLQLQILNAKTQMPSKKKKKKNCLGIQWKNMFNTYFLGKMLVLRSMPMLCNQSRFYLHELSKKIKLTKA